MARTHFVEVPCLCTDIQNCRMEAYVADIRTLASELHQAREELRATVCEDEKHRKPEGETSDRNTRTV